MARIAGVNIPVRKHIVIALTYIYGIGLPTAQKICKDCEISERKLPTELSEDELASIRSLIEKQYVVEGDLRRNKDRAIKRLISMRSYRGMRHQNKLPVRGQRSSTNARTRKKGIN